LSQSLENFFYNDTQPNFAAASSAKIGNSKRGENTMTNTLPEKDLYTLINVFTVDPDKQQQLVDTLIETTEGWVKPQPGFISASIHKSLDGTKVVNYSHAQQSNKEGFDQRGSDPQMRARMGLAVQLGQPDAHLYTIARTITGSFPSGNSENHEKTSAPEKSPYTLINVFTVDPDKQQQLVDLLIETTEGWAKSQPGFILARVHKSLDRIKVVNYAQWENKEASDLTLSDPQMRARMGLAVQLGRPDAHFYTIARTITSSPS
jgi:quinol monooxygenase YgiN